jgi:regulator of sigma E protease
LEQSPTPDRPDPLSPVDGTPASGGPEPAPLPEPLTPVAWLAANAPYLVILLAGIALLYWKKGIEGVYLAALVAIGLGFVIFIHELGHFLAAKWCDVHVQTFSIGFGPALPGCSFQRGETTYKIAVLPLGGFVQMVGEGPEADENENYARSFKNKTVGQRMLIISAGVIMNVLLACVCFIVVFRYHGVEKLTAVVWSVEPGSPAWKAGVRTDTQITRIGDQQNPTFNDLRFAVALSSEGARIPFVFRTPDGKEFKVELEPRLEKTDLMPVIGVSPSYRLKLWPAQARKHRELPVVYTSAASRAKAVSPSSAVGQGFEFDDAIIGTTDPDQPEATYDPRKVTDLPPDPFGETKEARDPFEFRRRMKLLAGKPVVVRVRRAGADEDDPPVDVLVEPAFRRTFGMRMKMGEITAVRADSPAARAGVTAGDVLSKVKLTFAEGAPVTLTDFDPVRLPYQLAQAVRKAGPGEAKVTLTVLRENPITHAGSEETVLPPVTWDDSWRFNEEAPLRSASAPLSIPQLGLAYRIESTVVAVEPDSPAAKAGVASGDRIEQIKFRERGKTAAEDKWPDNWTSLKAKGTSDDGPFDQWAHYDTALQIAESPDVQIKLKRASDSAKVELTLQASEDRTWPLSERGLLLVPDTRLQKADTLLEAVWMGTKDTGDSIKLIYLQLKSLLTRRISHENIGGPIAIATQAFDAAGQDLFVLVLFLGMISVNLAVINFLPIPLLDGGHMVFLLYEKLRGKPASDAVRTWATYGGLLVLASLMIFVFYRDIKVYVFRIGE